MLITYYPTPGSLPLTTFACTLFLGISHQNHVSFEKITINLRALPEKPDVGALAGKKMHDLMERYAKHEREKDTRPFISASNELLYASSADYPEEFKNIYKDILNMNENSMIIQF